jgi:hypothetical protein
MPQLSVDLSNPLVQPEADAQVLGVIRLSNTERFSFYSLDACCMGSLPAYPHLDGGFSLVKNT